MRPSLWRTVARAADPRRHLAPLCHPSCRCAPRRRPLRVRLRRCSGRCSMVAPSCRSLVLPRRLPQLCGPRGCPPRKTQPRPWVRAPPSPHCRRRRTPRRTRQWAWWPRTAAMQQAAAVLSRSRPVRRTPDQNRLLLARWRCKCADGRHGGLLHSVGCAGCSVHMGRWGESGRCHRVVLTCQIASGCEQGVRASARVAGASPLHWCVFVFTQPPLAVRACCCIRSDGTRVGLRLS